MSDLVSDEIDFSRPMNLLVLDTPNKEMCMDSLTRTVPGEQNALVVTVLRQPQEYIDGWQDTCGELPAKLVLVGVKDMTDKLDSGPDGDVGLVTVNSPSDLTGLSIRVGEALTELDELNDRQIVVCFNSITPLLQYIDLQTGYRFINSITGRLRTMDAYAHFHVDPSAHDPQEIETLKALFDLVVEPQTNDGAVSWKQAE